MNEDFYSALSSFQFILAKKGYLPCGALCFSRTELVGFKPNALHFRRTVNCSESTRIRYESDLSDLVEF